MRWLFLGFGLIAAAAALRALRRSEWESRWQNRRPLDQDDA